MNNKQSEEYLKKNRPNKILPIINTCFGALFLIGSIYCKIRYNDIYPTLYFILFNVLVMLFPLASWYNSYFSKKQKTKMLGSFEKETELIVEFMQYRKHYKAFEESERIKVFVDLEKCNEVGKFTYNKEKSSLGFPDHANALISIGIGFAGIEIDPIEKCVIGVKGLLPRSIWLKKRLKAPNSIKGNLKIRTEGVDVRNFNIASTFKA
jgi:hypothetical protein